MRGKSPGSAFVRRATSAAAVVPVYAGLAVWIFHPLFADPARTVVDAGLLPAPDVNLIMWVLSWDWHALTPDPRMLFNANIFHPAPAALASSEHMLGHVPLFGPIYALSGNPVLANQLNLLLGFAFSGAAMYALLRHWGAPAMAALFGGYVYAFCPIRGNNLAHSHLLAGQYLPLTLLLLDRTLSGGRLRTAAAFAVCLLLHMLCSYYLAYVGLVALAGYAAGVLWAARGRARLGGVVLVAIAGILVGAAVGALSIPYMRLKEIGVVPDHELTGLVKLGSAHWWRNFLLPPVALRKWGYNVFPGLPVYVGVLPLLCAAAALVRARHASARPVPWATAAAFCLTAACYLMAIGPEIELGGWRVRLPYALALRIVPGFSAMRVPSRAGFALMLGIAALSGLGVARLLGFLRCVRGGGALTAAALVVLFCGVTVEYDLPWREFKIRRVSVGPELPRVYRRLAELPAGPVLELPWLAVPGSAVGLVKESEYVFYSSYHWQRLLNGYSGYPPPSYAPAMTLAQLLPDARATELLVRSTGMRYVVVHVSKLPPAEQRRWQAPAGLKLVGAFGEDLLFTVADPPAPDLLPKLIDHTSHDTTVLGTRLASLPEAERRAEIVLLTRLPRAVPPGLPFNLDVTVTNRSAVTWPALSPVTEHLVTLAYRWETEAGEVVRENAQASRLPYDLAPGESVRAVMTVIGHVPGTLRLVIGLAQDGVWFPEPLPPIPLAVRPRNQPAREL